jgi:hypothetical protein
MASRYSAPLATAALADAAADSSAACSAACFAAAAAASASAANLARCSAAAASCRAAAALASASSLRPCSCSFSLKASTRSITGWLNSWELTTYTTAPSTCPTNKATPDLPQGWTHWPGRQAEKFHSIISIIIIIIIVIMTNRRTASSSSFSDCASSDRAASLEA